MLCGGTRAGSALTGMSRSRGNPNRVTLEDASDGTPFETIDDYCYMVGRETPAISSWGIEA